MAQRLPRLRLDLEFMPSPAPDRPGLLIRDPYRYSDASLIVPPALMGCLQLFDGGHTELDLRSELVRLTGDLKVGELQQHLVDTLSQAGFLEDETSRRMKAAQIGAFAEAARREPSHAGAAYPEEAEELRATLAGWMDPGAPAAAGNSPIGIAAPHVSPDGGRESYRAAYAALGPQYQERVFVILGTSHYGEPERFGLTRKPFATPLGVAQTEVALAERLAQEAGPAAKMEDYCHAVEHSIEFQVVFLQHLYGAGIRILPILCGAFARGILEGGRPEQDDNLRRFFDALGALAAREGERLFWVLGVDMAHMGRRYGDSFEARAGEGQMSMVAELDRQRIERLAAGDAEGFWSAVQKNRDPLKWCGAAPFYTFLKAVPQARGELLHYQQWNIDEESVVTFGAMAFRQNLEATQ
jgi:AmmeMemoRadiSam system protein B